MEPTTYTYARELAQLDRWNVTRVILETKAKRATYYRLMKDAASRPNSQNEISMKILKLHRQNVPSPLGDLQMVADQVHLLQQSLPTEDYEGFLQSQLELVKFKMSDGVETIDDAVLCYLYGLIGYQLRFGVRSGASKVPSVFMIAAMYKAAHDRLAEEDGHYHLLALKAAMTSLVIDFMSRPVESRSTDDGIRQKILDQNFFEAAEKILQLEEWCWKAARNALVAASVMQDMEKCQYFWGLLKKAHPGFEDIDYGPNGLPTIREDSDLWWFRDKLINN